MSFGTKIFSLLFILIALIVYTVASFDYSKIQDNSAQTVSTNEKLINFDTQVVINYIEEIKNKALKIKDELLKDSLESTNQSNTNLESEIKQSEEQVQDKLISGNDMVDEEVKQEEILNQDENQNSVDKVEDTQEKQEESLKEEEVIEEPSITPKEIQEQINTILKENKIIFKRRSVDITTESFSSVQKVADILKEHENIKVEIAGHTDSRGRASLNLRISQDRANSVKKSLSSLGINKDRLKAVGYGEKFPIVKDDKNGLSEINRRVEINIIGEN